MRSLMHALPVAVVLASTVAVIAIEAEPVVAAPRIELVANGGLIRDISDDGRFVLVGSMWNSDTVLLDRTTMSQRPVPSGVLSGDGQHVAFATSAGLVSSDVDGAADVYVLDVASDAVTLRTHGLPGWDFSPASTDADGSSVLVLGYNGNAARVTPFVGSPSATVELGATLEPMSGARAFSLSDDGRYALFSADSAFSGAHHGELYREDTTTHERVIVNTTVAGSHVRPTTAVMSGDGGTVLVATTTAVYKGPARRDGLVALSQAATVQWQQVLDLSDDGSIAIWVEKRPTVYAGITGDDDQLMLDDPAGRRVISVPTGGSANGGVRGGSVVAGDGSSVAFTSLATNLTATVTSDWSGYLVQLAPSTTASSPSAYTARTPTRILDTRIALGVHTTSLPAAPTTIALPIRGAHGVPADASAVAVQIAAAEGTGVGFVSVIPGGAAPGLTANLNLDRPGKVIANMAVVPIGADGTIDVYVQARTHVIVDLLGWWRPAPFGASAGRLHPIGPNRILDTRPETALGYSGAKPATAGTTIVQVTGQGGVPASGVSAVVLNVAVDQPTGPGYVQVTPASSLVVGAASTLNVDVPGQIVSAATIVPVDADGRIAIYTLASAHLIVDVAGWFTDASAPVAGDGRLVPYTSIARVLDTRQSGAKPAAGSQRSVGVTANAVVGNLAITETDAGGFVQLGPTVGFTPGATANVNATGAGVTISNAFIVPAVGGLRAYTYDGTHIIVDVSGYMT